MTTFKIFQLEKNNEDIRKTLLTNVVRMFTERKLLKRENLEDNINKMINIYSDDYTYTLNIDNYKNDSDKKYIIKIFNQKITAISKQSGISDFLIKFKDVPKLIIVKSISTKAFQHVMNNYPKTEIFMESFLMINLIENILVPKYEILENESDEFKKFFEEYQCKKKQIPKMYMSDPVAKYYNLKRSDLVRVIRPSETAGESSFYRLVI